MNIKSYLTTSLCSLVFLTTTAQAQMFYNAGSSFDTEKTTSHTSFAKDMPAKRELEPFEKLIAQEIRERVTPDASYILAEPDETLCYGVARKSPMRRTLTINGYAHTGNCGSLNDMGLSEVQKRLFDIKSYETPLKKASSCIVSPQLTLRFRKGFDFVDVVISGANCPAVSFLYAGETKEFSAKPMGEWLNEFITAVSNDLEPIDEGKIEQQASVLFKKQEKEEPAKQVKTETAPAAPTVWGRRAVRPKPEAQEIQMDASIPPPER